MLVPDRPIRIRDFDPTDLDRTLALFHQTVHTVNRRDYTPEQLAAWAPDVPDRGAWLARLSAGWTRMACERDQIIGFGQLLSDGRIEYFYVDAHRQRQGIGSLLLERLVELAREQGIAQLSTAASITAQPFFARHGFVIVRRQTVSCRGAEFENFVMRRALQRHADQDDACHDP
jgi:putative acetyltransferase